MDRTERASATNLVELVENRSKSLVIEKNSLIQQIHEINSQIIKLENKRTSTYKKLILDSVCLLYTSRKLLVDIGLDDDKIEEVFSHAYYLWNRDKQSRTKSVHFFIDKSKVYRDDQLNHFAINLGGEILRRSLNAIDRDLYKDCLLYTS